VVACPFGVIDRRDDDGRAWKCTLCYDRLGEDMTPACAKHCPTESIVFGDLDELHERARKRVERLHEQGVTSAYLYGADAENQPGTGGLNSFFLLVDKPEVYNLPPDPVVPTKKQAAAWTSVALGSLFMAAAALGVVWMGRQEGL
jgi:formate dehydrogenase iron-sulfur subunit